MVKSIIEFPERENRILNIVKAQHGFKNKKEACVYIVGKHEQDLEFEINPEYLKKLKKIRKGKYHKFKDVNDLRKQIEG